MADVVAVTDDGLAVLEPSGDRTPIAELIGEDTDAGERTTDEVAAGDDNSNGLFDDLR